MDIIRILEGSNDRQREVVVAPRGMQQACTTFTKTRPGAADTVCGSHAAGTSGTQMAGWFDKAIHSIDDTQGTKMRIQGFGEEMFQRAGVVVARIA